MAGISISLKRIFKHPSITFALYGIGYSSVVTITPMFVIIGVILLMYSLLGFDTVSYFNRELFSSTMLYIFIFSLITTAPFNSVLSKYMADKIYEERYEDILPTFYTGLAMNLGLACLLGIPFYSWVHVVGGVPLYYVFTSYCGFIGLVLTFYAMLYLSITKDYKKISLFYLIGMLVALIISLMLVKSFHVEITYAMLLSLSIGFLTIATLEYAWTKNYFPENSRDYKGVLKYFKTYWKLIFANSFYILGLYIHNFVFWTTKYQSIVVNSYLSNKTYDMASCIAMFTNISATVIFITQVEMHFHERYKAYSESVLGGKLKDIEKAKKRMFRQLAKEITVLVQIQFTISVIIFLLCLIFLPSFGFSGLVLSIYPCLAAAYFVVFVMYSEIIFLNYYDDLDGTLLVNFSFFITTFIVSLIARSFNPEWFGIGLFAGAMVGWTVAFFRLMWVEKNLDTHIFCRGSILKQMYEKRPDAVVFNLEKTKKQLASTFEEEEAS